MIRPTGRPIEARLRQRLRDYWFERVRQHVEDTYAGIPMAKFPEDLRVYDHIIWESEANVVVEIGTHWGGSALWFRDRLQSLWRYRPHLPRPQVISLDLDSAHARGRLAELDPEYEQTITLLEGDVRDDAVAASVRRAVPQGSRCLVIDDSAHTYQTTEAALRHLADLVPLGGCFVAEDGCVDIEAMRVDDSWPRGVLPAVDDWLATEAGSRFIRRRDLELYGVTCHPRGYLQRRS